MDIKEVKEYLNRAFTMDRELRAKRTQIQILRERRFSIGVILGVEKVQTSHSTDKTGDTSVRFLDMIDEYVNDLNRLLDHQENIKVLISKLENPIHRLIMEERYINLKKWEDIAADNSYSWRTIHRLHVEALKGIEKDGIVWHTLDKV